MTRFLPNKRCGVEWLIETTRPWLTLAPHPNVATLFSMEHLDGVAVLRSEAVLGASLDERLRAGPLPAAEFEQVVRELGAALSHVHSHQVVHGTLHPTAIAFGSGGALKLLRWSPEHLASWGDDWSAGAPPMVMHYQAPEQIRAEMNLLSSDIYGMGVLLYRASAGWPPFHGEDLAELCYQILTQEAPPLHPPPGYPERLTSVLADCLAKSPEHRPPGIRELIRALYPDAVLPEIQHDSDAVYQGGDNRPRPDPAPVETPPITREFPKPKKPRHEPVTITERKISSLAKTVTVSTLRVTSGCTAGWLSKAAGGWTKLRHPNIAALYRIEEWHGLVRAHSEPVVGPDLHEFLEGLADKKYPLSELDFRRFAVGLLAALSHAHDRRVLHGALAPDCVVLTEDGSVRVLRFSAEHLKAIAGPGRQMHPLSLLSYQAPEQFHGITTAASDIYAIGMLLYHVALGKLPFQLADPSWMAGRIANRKVGLIGIPKSYPKHLAGVIADCLAADPRERPESAAAVLRRLYPDETPLDEVESRWQIRQEAVEWLEEGRMEAARDAWATICESEPNDAWSLNNLGVAMSRLGLVAEAAEKFRLAAERLPENAVVACNLGWALYDSGGSRREALDCLDRAVELDSTNARAFHLRGLCRGGHRAIGDFVQALWLDPGRTESYLTLADELEAAEQFDAAQLRREQAAQCARPPAELWPELIFEEKPSGWSGGENWPPSPIPFESDSHDDHDQKSDSDDERREGDDDGGAPVPRRRPPHAPSASEAKALPHPYEIHQHPPRYLHRAR